MHASEELSGDKNDQLQFYPLEAGSLLASAVASDVWSEAHAELVLGMSVGVN